MAARICIDHNCDPADVYGIYLSELKTLMTNGIEVPQMCIRDRYGICRNRNGSAAA